MRVIVLIIVYQLYEQLYPFRVYHLISDFGEAHVSKNPEKVIDTLSESIKSL